MATSDQGIIFGSQNGTRLPEKPSEVQLSV